MTKLLREETRALPSVLGIEIDEALRRTRVESAGLRVIVLDRFRVVAGRCGYQIRVQCSHCRTSR